MLKSNKNQLVNYPLAILILLLSFGFKHQSPKWELRKNENGIAVYTKDTATSSFKELKVETTFNASLSSIVALIKDIPSHPQWIYNCKQAYIVKTVNERELYYYHETYAPWPVSNRDGVVYYKISQDSITKIVTVDSENAEDNLVAETEEKVRVPKLKASWKFTPKADKTVAAEYYLYVNPGGDVPAWLVNMFLVDGPYNTIISMKKMLSDKKYTAAKINFIKE